VSWLVSERVRGLLHFSCCEKLVAEAEGQIGNLEEGECPPLGDATR
jgi:hypothetical protein